MPGDTGILLKIVDSLGERLMKWAGIDLGDGSAAAKVSIAGPTSKIIKVMDIAPFNADEVSDEIDISDYSLFAIDVVTAGMNGNAECGVSIEYYNGDEWIPSNLNGSVGIEGPNVGVITSEYNVIPPNLRVVLTQAGAPDSSFDSVKVYLLLNR